MAILFRNLHAKNGSYKTFPTPVSNIYQLAWTARIFSPWNKHELYVCAGYIKQQLHLDGKKWPHLGSCPFIVHQQRAVSKIHSLFRVHDY